MVLNNENNIVVGIDLATRQSGIVILENKRFSGCAVVKLQKWNNTTKYFNDLIETMNKITKDIYAMIKTKNISKISLVIELSNFSNPQLTQRMSFIAGVIYATFCKYFVNYNIELKLPNANKWFQFFNRDFCKIQDWTHLTRSERKSLSLKHCFKQEDVKNHRSYRLLIMHKNEVLFDIADAYWVAYYGDSIEE